MAHIKEPVGIDFLIESQPLTDKEKQEISEFIKKRKAFYLRKSLPKKRKIKEEVN
ncbi:MAG: hypothetical protein IH598_00045 [Bacteroidales bacterium]|nr:hypothetical protein [Bacteroidales bacterium]